MRTYENVAVVGMRFRGADVVQLVDSLAVEGEPVEFTLKREPENPHDPNAIQVFYEDTFIGYIERGQACFISPDMDEGWEAVCTCELFQIDSRGKHYVPITTVRTIEPESAE